MNAIREIARLFGFLLGMFVVIVMSASTMYTAHLTIELHGTVAKVFWSAFLAALVVTARTMSCVKDDDK